MCIKSVLIVLDNFFDSDESFYGNPMLTQPNVRMGKNPSYY